MGNPGLEEAGDHSCWKLTASLDSLAVMRDPVHSLLARLERDPSVREQLLGTLAQINAVKGNALLVAILTLSELNVTEEIDHNGNSITHAHIIVQPELFARLMEEKEIHEQTLRDQITGAFGAQLSETYLVVHLGSSLIDRPD